MSHFKSPLIFPSCYPTLGPVSAPLPKRVEYVCSLNWGTFSYDLKEMACLRFVKSVYNSFSRIAGRI